MKRTRVLGQPCYSLWRLLWWGPLRGRSRHSEAKPHSRVNALQFVKGVEGATENRRKKDALSTSNQVQTLGSLVVAQTSGFHGPEVP